MRIGRWRSELLLGARLVVAGGRAGWVRAGLTAVGIGLGVAVLLLAAAVPGALQAREDREAQRSILREYSTGPAGDTVLVDQHDLQFRTDLVRGVVLRPESPAAPVPPGLSELPGPGELVVSPALADLLDSDSGALLRPRLDYPRVGTIGDEGLRSPHELAFYLGADATTLDEASAWRLDGFGNPSGERNPLHPVLVLLLVIGVVVLLLPVAMFVAVVVRFGGEHRDRRLAGLRLVGADAGATRRIAAGEALVAAAAGLVAGVGFFLLGRQLGERVVVADLSVFAGDLRPDPVLAAVVVVLVPALAVAVTLLAMRGLIVEPLGVVRRARGIRRRAWWRFAVLAAGSALLYPLTDGEEDLAGQVLQYQVAAGAVLLLLGVAALVPWLLDLAVGALGGGGSPSWQLAVRRLQLGSGTGRVVNGIAVAAAGGIALQMFFTGIQGDFTTTADIHPDRVPVVANVDERTTSDRAESMAAGFAGTTGVRTALGVSRASVRTGDHGEIFRLLVGSCGTLTALADIGRCTDGDVFAGEPVAAGDVVELYADADPREWTVPEGVTRFASFRNDWVLGNTPVLLVTPAAAAEHSLPAGFGAVYLELDPAEPDAIEHVRNTAAGIDLSMRVHRWQTEQEDEQFADVRRGLLVGVTVTLGLIGLGLLLSTVEQLRERRRQLAVLVAFGTRRRTLGWSILWQTAVPMLLGLLLALITGTALGALLLSITSTPIVVDPWNVVSVVGIAAGVLLLVTVLAMPVLWRLMRPDGLRAE